LAHEARAQDQRLARDGVASVRLESCRELVETFAQTGRLPWWAPRAADGLVGASLKTLIEQDRGRTASWLSKLVRGRAEVPAAIQRLTSECDDALLSGLLVGPDGRQAGRAELAVLSAVHRHLDGVTPGRFRGALWAAIVEAGQGRAPHTRHQWSAVIASVAMRLGAPLPMVVAAFMRAAESQPLDAGLLADSAQVLFELGVAAPGATHAGRASLPTSARSDNEQRHPASDQTRAATMQARGQTDPAPTRRAEPRRRQASAASRNEPASVTSSHDRSGPPGPQDAAHAKDAGASGAPIRRQPPDSPRAAALERSTSTLTGDDVAYVDNAGLVLLSPFLTTLFDRLALLTKVEHSGARRTFVGPDARQRAVALLQYLASGDRNCAEYQLTLNKVLCGLAPDDLFELDEPLTSTELGTCDELLVAALEHGSALGAVSPEGFRASFLVREGTLRSEGPAWLLRVERRSYDLLLDRLPWQFEWVTLPWMQAPMRVHW
jgi:hypothetical protein